jgi:hypothetical protein
MASEILGLFTSPEMYQQQQDLMMERQAAELAQLDPYQSIRFGAIRAGQQFGRGLAGLLGAEDPQLRMISARQSVLGGLDLSNPEAIFSAARQLSGMRDPQGALALAEYGRKVQGDKALAEQRTRERTSPALLAAARIRELESGKQKLIAEGASADSPELKLIDTEISDLRRGGRADGGGTNEQKNAFALASLKGEPGSEAFNTEYAKQLPLMLGKGGAKDADKQLVLADAIVDLEKQIRNAPDPNSPDVTDLKTKLEILRGGLRKDKPNLTVVGEVKTGPDKGKAVFVDEMKDEQFVYDVKDGKQVRKPFVGDVDRITTQVTATATSSLPSGPKQVVEGLAKLDVEEIAIARANKRNAVASNTALARLADLDSRGLIGGSFAANRVGAANFLNSLGLISKSDADTLSRSEQFQKSASDLILQSMGGKLGGGISNVDLEFVKGVVPRLENSASARRELIDYLRDRNSAIIKEADSAENYLRKNQSLSGYTPTYTGIFTGPSSVGGTLTNMTDAQLKAERARLTGGKK